MIRRKIFAPLMAASLLALSACGDTATQPSETKADAPAQTTLESVINHTRRDKNKARDQYRHPKETLEFFEVGPGKHVVEVWPGWYTHILAPYLKDNGGTYTAVLYEESERSLPRIKAFKETFADTDTYGTLQYGALGADTVAMMPAESADIVLTFRNVHNWMGTSGYTENAFKQFYDALKPGGILGVVEHRLPESATQDPTGGSGYVQESYMKALAKDAGFEFVSSSEINANPKDTADHPFGVWTLQPSSYVPKDASEIPEGFDAESYKAIGESDRATLKFRKPL